MRSWRLRDFFLVPEIAALGPATKMYDLVEYIYACVFPEFESVDTCKYKQGYVHPWV